MTNLHDSLQAEILRRRWIKWAIRQYKPGDYPGLSGRLKRLLARLKKFKPTWEQINADSLLDETDMW